MPASKGASQAHLLASIAESPLGERDAPLQPLHDDDDEDEDDPPIAMRLAPASSGADASRAKDLT